MRFKTILIDPPYPFKNKNTGGSLKSGSSHKYPVLTMAQLRSYNFAMNMRALADDDAVLFLWTPVALLDDALDLMQRWDFKFRSSLFWHKVGRLGMGFWFRNQVEMCLFGVRGKVQTFRSSMRNVIEAKPTGHSQKPEEIFQLIEPMTERFKLLPRIELFAREYRVGWYSYGNDLGGDLFDILPGCNRYEWDPLREVR